MASDESTFDFPPLTQSMRLNIEGGPMYRGGRGGRAGAAYYREKELIILIKNKYGSRFGRRIQPFKPDKEAWRPEKYHKSNDRLNCQKTVEIIPGGLQNKKLLSHNNHDGLEKKTMRVVQQEEFSQGNHLPDKCSPVTVKSEAVPVTAIRTSDTELAELGIPSKQGRGRMRGKRVVDIPAIFCTDDEENTRYCGPDQSAAQLVTSVENLRIL